MEQKTGARNINILSLLASDNYIVMNRDLLKEYGINATLMLCELASEFNYFDKNGKLEDGMFYSTIENISERTGLSKYQQAEALKVLDNIGLVESVVKGIPAKRYFKIDVEKLTNQIVNNSHSSCQKTGKLDSEKLATKSNNKKVINKTNNKDLSNTNVLDKGDNVARETVSKSNPQKVTKKAEPDSKPSYGNSAINAMFDYWQECVGTPIISREKGNRRACYNLLRNKHIGEEKLRHAVEFVGEIKENRFAPRISDFVDLQSKFNELCAFKTKYQAQQDVSDDKTPNRAVSSAMKGYNSAGGNVEFVPWRPTAGDLEREREWNEKERRQTEESAKVDPEWLEKLKQETIRKIYSHGDRK